MKKTEFAATLRGAFRGDTVNIPNDEIKYEGDRYIPFSLTALDRAFTLVQLDTKGTCTASFDKPPVYTGSVADDIKSMVKRARASVRDALIYGPRCRAGKSTPRSSTTKRTINTSPEKTVTIEYDIRKDDEEIINGIVQSLRTQLPEIRAQWEHDCKLANEELEAKKTKAETSATSAIEQLASLDPSSLDAILGLLQTKIEEARNNEK